MNKLNLSLAALGVSAALVAGPATAAINWNPDGIDTVFQDNNIDFLLDSDLNAKAGGIIQVNDVLVSVFELDGAGGGPILPDELTGISAIQVDTITATADPIKFDLTFRPYDGGLDAILALGSNGKTVLGGGAGGDAMVAMWLDPTPNLDVSADNLPVPPGSLSCTTLGQCIDQAVDGGDFAGNEANPWEVDGLPGTDGDEQWIAEDAVLNTALVLATSPAFEVGDLNAALSVIYNGTGRTLGQTLCFPFCGTGAGADGLIDLAMGGSVKGGRGLPGSLIGDGAVATSDFDFVKVAVPEPSILALLAAGFLGMGAVQRRRRKAIGQ